MKKKNTAKVANGKVDRENPEWISKDFGRAMGFRDLSPSQQQSLSRRHRGPQQAPKKVPVSIRLSPEVVKAFRDSGAGWQARVDEILKAHIK